MTRKHVYRAKSVGKGCSPAKTSSARLNGTLGGRPPWRRYAVVETPAGAWAVLDRADGSRLPARSQARARAIARALETGAPAPPSTRRVVWTPARIVGLRQAVGVSVEAFGAAIEVPGRIVALLEAGLIPVDPPTAAALSAKATRYLAAVALTARRTGASPPAPARPRPRSQSE